MKMLIRQVLTSPPRPDQSKFYASRFAISFLQILVSPKRCKPLLFFIIINNSINLQFNLQLKRF